MWSDKKDAQFRIHTCVCKDVWRVADPDMPSRDGREGDMVYTNKQPLIDMQAIMSSNIPYPTDIVDTTLKFGPAEQLDQITIGSKTRNSPHLYPKAHHRPMCTRCICTSLIEQRVGTYLVRQKDERARRAMYIVQQPPSVAYLVLRPHNNLIAPLSQIMTASWAVYKDCGLTSRSFLSYKSFMTSGPKSRHTTTFGRLLVR